MALLETPKFIWLAWWHRWCLVRKKVITQKGHTLITNKKNKNPGFHVFCPSLGWALNKALSPLMLKASSYEYNLSFWVPEDSACQTVLRFLQVTLTAVPGWWKEGSWQLQAIKFTVWTNHGLLHMEICSILRQKMQGALRPHRLDWCSESVTGPFFS